MSGKYAMGKCRVTVSQDGFHNKPIYIYLPNHPDVAGDRQTAGCAAITQDAGHGVYIDYDAQGNVIGVEVI